MDIDDSENRVAQLEQQLNLLVKANQQLNHELSMPVIYETLVEYGLKLINATAGTAGILKDGQMHFNNYYKNGHWRPIHFSFKPGQGVPGWVAANLIPYISHDALNDPEVVSEIQQELGFVTLITVPIIDHHGTLIGCMELHNKINNGLFSRHDIDILEGLCACAAIAINNATKVEQQQEVQQVLQQSENRFVQSQRFANIGTWDWNIETGELYWSEQIAPLFGYPVGELKTTYDNFLAAVHDDDRQAVNDAINTCVEKGTDYEIEHRIVWPDGSIHYVLERGDTVKGDDGKATRMLGVVQDITQRKKAEEQLQLSAMVLENTPEGVMITDPQLKIISVNPAFTRTTGYSPEEMLGMRPGKLSSGRHNGAFYTEMWRSIHETGQWQGEIWNRRKDGEIYPEWLNINVIKNSSGKVINYASIFSDISTQEHVRKRLHNLAYYDALTKLPNRELFHDRLENTLIQSRRHGTHVGLMFLDMDRFKNINDSLGHRVGDEFLKLFAERLQHCVRDMDTVARLGGDEFTIILPDISSPRDVAFVAEKIVNSYATPMNMEDGHELFPSASIGISLYPEDGDKADPLIKNADTAMYRAKEAGRGVYQFYTTEMSANFAERLLIETDLRRAINEKQFTLAYQPQIDLTTGHLVGFEALIRWNHPKKGPISPALFIPIAEESGQIEKLGEWVLTEACRQLKLWQTKYGNKWRMAVNFSGQQLRNQKIIASIENTLQSAGVSSDMLEIELTESTMMDNVESNIEIIDQLSSRGFLLAVDDFGTGYSSLSYLKRFNIDKLKIDQSFVRDITLDNNDAEIVATIIAMAHNLGLQVIAEGVENQQQLDFLRAKGCDEVQGYFISRPKSAQEIDAMLISGELSFSKE